MILALDNGPISDLVFLHGPTVARMLSLAAALAQVAICLNSMIRPQSFTHFLLANYLLLGATLVIALEANSPQITPFLLDRLPDLRKMTYRAALYILIGTLLIGPEWGSLGRATGIWMDIAGLVWLAVWWVNRRKGLAVSAQISAATMSLNPNQGEAETENGENNPTAFLRFEEDGEVPKADGATYQQV